MNWSRKKRSFDMPGGVPCSRKKNIECCPFCLESYYGSSVQSALLKGLKKASKATGEAIAKVPVISKGQLDEALIEAGDKLDSIGSKRVSTQMKKFSGREKDCVGPFVENIRALNKLYNNSTIEMLFDEQNVYISSQK